MIVCMEGRGGTNWEKITLRTRLEIFGSILIPSARAIFKLVGGIIAENAFKFLR